MRVIIVLIIVAVLIVILFSITQPGGLDSIPWISSELENAPTPIPINQGLGYSRNLTIRLDSVKVLEDDMDMGLGGEAIFSIFAIRKRGLNEVSGKLVSPGVGSYQVRVGETLHLGDFSLQLNHVAEDEQISIYFLGFESDDIGQEQDVANASIDVLIDLVVDHVLPIDSGIAKFAVENLTGAALDWWMQQDLLGEYFFYLDRTNDWLQGEQYYAQSTNGNLEIAFTIMQSTEILKPPEETVTLTVVNKSSRTINSLYITPSANTLALNKISTSIEPGEQEIFALEIGSYFLRAESVLDIFWEKGPVEIERDQEWIIRN